MIKLLPIIALIVCAAIGLAIGKVLQPEPDEIEGADAEKDSVNTENSTAAEHEPGTAPPMMDYVKLNNQFVIPIVQNERVSSLVVLSLSIEVPEGKQDKVLKPAFPK